MTITREILRLEDSLGMTEPEGRILKLESGI